jgi:hypothetical protein
MFVERPAPAEQTELDIDLPRQKQTPGVARRGKSV